MSINWIKLDVALPRLKVTEDKDYVYFSDTVLVLCEDGFITTAKHEVFQDDDLTISNYFMSENDDLYEKHNAVIAWAPLSEVHPEWFDEAREVKKMLIELANQGQKHPD